MTQHTGRNMTLTVDDGFVPTGRPIEVPAITFEATWDATGLSDPPDFTLRIVGVLECPDCWLIHPFQTHVTKCCRCGTQLERQMIGKVIKAKGQ